MNPPTHRPAAIALWITAVLIAFFAVGLVVSPGELQTGHGVAAAPVGAYATEFRATSGGFKLGTAIAMGLMTWSRRYGEGLILAVAVLACSGSARAIGCALGDGTTLHSGVAAAELFGALSCGWHLWRLSAGAGESTSPSRTADRRNKRK